MDDEDIEDDPSDPVQRLEGSMVIPFKNENLYVELDKGNGEGSKIRFFFLGLAASALIYARSSISRSRGCARC